MTEPTDPVAWLLERVAEDEELDVHMRGCRTLRVPPDSPPGLRLLLGDQLTCDCPMIDRARAQGRAVRLLAALHSSEAGQHPDFCGHDRHQVPCPTLRLVLSAYADRYGFLPEWGRGD